MQSRLLQLMMVLLDFAHGSGLAVSLGGELVSLARSLAAWVSDWLEVLLGGKDSVDIF